jgi:hypothetical protein
MSMEQRIRTVASGAFFLAPKIQTNLESLKIIAKFAVEPRVPITPLPRPQPSPPEWWSQLYQAQRAALIDLNVWDAALCNQNIMKALRDPMVWDAMEVRAWQRSSLPRAPQEVSGLMLAFHDQERGVTPHVRPKSGRAMPADPTKIHRAILGMRLKFRRTPHYLAHKTLPNGKKEAFRDVGMVRDLVLSLLWDTLEKEGLVNHLEEEGIDFFLTERLEDEWILLVNTFPEETTYVRGRAAWSDTDPIGFLRTVMTGHFPLLEPHLLHVRHVMIGMAGSGCLPWQKGLLGETARLARIRSYNALSGSLL